MGLEERQARPHRQDRRHQQARPEIQGHRRPAPDPETPRTGPGILRRPAPALHHRITRTGRPTYALLSKSRGVTQPVPRVYLSVSLTAPGPSGSAKPARLCRGCSRPPRRPPDQAASSFTPPPRRRGDGRSLTSIRKRQRLVAHESSYEVTLSRSGGGPGTAGGSFAGQQVRQPNMGPGRPRECALAGGSAQVGIDLAGDVALQAADDFLLGFPLGGAAFDVGAGSRVRAHAGENDPP